MDNLLWFLLIGCAAGWLAGQLLQGRGFGFLGNLIVGVVGSLVGGLLYGLLGATTTSLWGSLISATIGAILFMVMLGALRRPKP